MTCGICSYSHIDCECTHDMHIAYNKGLQASQVILYDEIDRLTRQYDALVGVHVNKGNKIQDLTVRAISAEALRDTIIDAAFNALCECYNMWQDECWMGKPDGVNIEVVGFFRPYYESKLRHTEDLMNKFKNLKR